MSAPDPEGMSLLAKLMAAAAAVIAPIWGLQKWLDSRFDRKADKHNVATQFQRVENELGIQRSYFKDVFNQIRDNEQRAQDRHERLMERLTGERK